MKLQKPHISEKSTMLKDQNKYIFVVSKKANKNEIKKEIEKMYNVRVLDVNTIRIKPKNKRFKNIVYKKDKYKKAIITLKKGHKIDLI